MGDKQLRKLSHRLHDDIITKIHDYNDTQIEHERKDKRYTIEGAVIFSAAILALGFYLYAMFSIFIG